MATTITSCLSNPLFYIHSFTRHYNQLNNNKINSFSFKHNNNLKPSYRYHALPQSKSKSKPLKSSTPPSSSSNFRFPLLFRFRDAFRMDELGGDILSIALPALLALAADPITSLVDTAFVGHLGSIELAAVGVSVSIFNLVSKLFNVPLLNVTTSFVAEEQALVSTRNENPIQFGQDLGEKKKALPSVSSSLVLAAGLGLAEAVALAVGSGYMMNIMGFTNASAGRGVPYNEGVWCSTYCHCTCCSGNFQGT